MTQVSSEGSTVSTDDLGVPPTPPRSPPATSSTTNGMPINQPSWTDPSSPLKNKTPNPKTKSKIPFFDSINTKFMGQKKSKKSSSIGDDGRPKWNAGPGARKNDDYGSLRRKSITDLDSPGGRTISRSRSATSEGGFHSLGRDTSLRQSNRSPSCRPQVNSSGYGKNTWSGSRMARERVPLSADTYKPPSGVRSIRSASASPATARRHFGTSAPSTPVNRSPKRSAPASSLGSPTKPSPNSFMHDINNITAEPNIQILAHLEDLVNSYRARVLQSFNAEGKSLPPELADDYSWDNADQKPHSSLPNVRVNPRKASAGSKIPAPTFFVSP